MADNFEDKKTPEGNEWNERDKNNENNENNNDNEKKGLWDSFKEIFKWFTDKLKKNAVDSALDNLQANIEKWLNIDETDNETKQELVDFFNEWKNELEFIDTKEEEKLVEKLTSSGKFTKDREPEIVAKIVESADKIENEIKDWQKEKNPVARSLLKIVNWIMWTEK